MQLLSVGHCNCRNNRYPPLGAAHTWFTWKIKIDTTKKAPLLWPQLGCAWLSLWQGWVINQGQHLFLIPLPCTPGAPRCLWWRCDCTCTEGDILRPAKTLGSELSFPGSVSEHGDCHELWRPERVCQEEPVMGRGGPGLQLESESFPPSHQLACSFGVSSGSCLPGLSRKGRMDPAGVGVGGWWVALRIGAPRSSLTLRNETWADDYADNLPSDLRSRVFTFKYGSSSIK